jgi:cell division protease FtsH
MPVKAVDITGRHGGHTELGNWDDNLPETTTGQDLLNEMTMTLAAAAAERLIIGHGTTGSADDLRQATSVAYTRLSAGLDPDVPYISPDAIPFSLMPDSLGRDFYRAASATLAACRERADELVAKHQAAILSFATLLYARRRLAGAELDEALREVVA